MFKGIALLFLHVVAPRVSRTYETFVFFASAAGQASAGHGAKCLSRSKTTLLLLKLAKSSNAHFPKPFACF